MEREKGVESGKKTRGGGRDVSSRKKASDKACRAKKKKIAPSEVRTHDLLMSHYLWKL